jgi:hypothetical protein
LRAKLDLDLQENGGLNMKAGVKFGVGVCPMEKYLIDKPIIKFCKMFGRLPTQEEIAQLRNELEKTK